MEGIEPGRLLRLRAEMRLPGLAWLDMYVDPDGTGSRYRRRLVMAGESVQEHCEFSPPVALVILGSSGRDDVILLEYPCA